MKRSICYTEPPFAVAGTKGCWSFVYIPNITLPKESVLRFDLLSSGRPFDWELPKTKGKNNVIYIQKEGSDDIVLMRATKDPAIFEVTLPFDLKEAEKLQLSIGSTCDGEGNSSQSLTQRKKPFHLYVKPKGQERFSKDPEIFHIDVKGGKLAHLNIVTPSVAVKNKRFDIVIRFEDQYGNLTVNAPSETLIDVSYDGISGPFKWQIFVPETGFIKLPNIYFPESGIYRIKLTNLYNNTTFYSDPIKCYTSAEHDILWGMLHGESTIFDSHKSIEACLKYFRDDKSLHFYSTSPFEEEAVASDANWKHICTHVNDFHEENRFASFLGFQWIEQKNREGIRHIIHSKDNKPMLHKKDVKTNSLKKIYKSQSV